MGEANHNKSVKQRPCRSQPRTSQWTKQRTALEDDKKTTVKNTEAHFQSITAATSAITVKAGESEQICGRKLAVTSKRYNCNCGSKDCDGKRSSGAALTSKVRGSKIAKPKKGHEKHSKLKELAQVALAKPKKFENCRNRFSELLNIGYGKRIKRCWKLHKKVRPMKTCKEKRGASKKSFFKVVFSAGKSSTSGSLGVSPPSRVCVGGNCLVRNEVGRNLRTKTKKPSKFKTKGKQDELANQSSTQRALKSGGLYGVRPPGPVCESSAELFRKNVAKAQQILIKSAVNVQAAEIGERIVSVAAQALVVAETAHHRTLTSTRKPRREHWRASKAKKSFRFGEYRYPLIEVKAVGCIEHSKSNGGRLGENKPVQKSQMQASTVTKAQEQGVVVAKTARNSEPVVAVTVSSVQCAASGSTTSVSSRKICSKSASGGTNEAHQAQVASKSKLVQYAASGSTTSVVAERSAVKTASGSTRGASSTSK